MKDDEKNCSPEPSNKQARNPKEDIPLWLQGLEENTKAMQSQSKVKEETSGLEEEFETPPIPEVEPDESDTSIPSPADKVINDEFMELEDGGEISIIEDGNEKKETASDGFEELDLSADHTGLPGKESNLENIEDEETEGVLVGSSEEPGPDHKLPEWINEIPEMTDDSFPSNQKAENPAEPLEENFYFADDEPAEIEPESQIGFQDDSFIDISDAKLKTSQPELDSWEDENRYTDEEPVYEREEDLLDEIQEINDNEILPDDEELPKWLQRLIAESYPDQETDRIFALTDATSDEITKPIQINPLQIDEEEAAERSELTSIEEAIDIEEIEEFEEFVEYEEPDQIDLIAEAEEPEEEPSITEEEISVNPDLDHKVDENITPSGEPIALSEGNEPFEEIIDPFSSLEDTQPVGIRAPIEWSKEDNLYYNPEIGYLIDIPEQLLYARQVFKQGNIAHALNIIKEYIQNASYLDEIKTWLMEAADTSLDCLCEIWEYIGDIAAYQDHHQEALSAYTKAINYLLLNKDENGTC